MINNYSHLINRHKFHSTLSRSAQGSVPKSAEDKSAANKCDIVMKKPAETSFSGLLSAEAVAKFHRKPWLQKTLEFANDQQLVFGASFALILTCVLRPGAIMVFPSKKNKDDQKYASAHSIASGVIGFGISTAIFTPISSGIKKFCENAKSHIKNPSHYLLKDEAKLATAKVYLDRLPDIVTAVPKGILTIILIPPILKYVFGMEKKSAKNPTGRSVDYSLLNFRSKEAQFGNSFLKNTSEVK